MDQDLEYEFQNDYYDSDGSIGSEPQIGHMVYQNPLSIGLYPTGSPISKLQNEQVQVQYINQTPKGYELTQQNSSCSICCKYAINSVLCNNQKCRILFCKNCSVQTTKKNENKCPFCRISPFKPTPNPYRQLINKIELSCKLCNQKYKLQEEQNHYKIECLYFLKIQCSYCQERFESKAIVKHTRLMHQDKIDEIIEKMYERPAPMLMPKDVKEKQGKYLSQIGKAPKLGTTGKFYCGGQLDALKCVCCNGYCGTTNGCNCSECMKLDILRFGLPKGYLINSQGHVCWRQGNNFVCNVRVYHGEQFCHQNNPCRSCRNMSKTILRYKNLL